MNNIKTLKFYGCSDDTFGEYGQTDDDVDNCASGKPIQCLLQSGDDKMYVVGQYARNNTPCWDIGVCQYGEDISIPNWPMRFSADGYSVVFEIEVPDDATLTWFSNMRPIEV